MTVPGTPEAPRTAPVLVAPPEEMREEAARRARAAESTAADAAASLPPAPLPPVASTRRAARAARLLAVDDDPARRPRAHHARPRRRLARLGVVAAIAVGGAMLLGSSAALTAMIAPPAASDAPRAALAASTPAQVEQLPVPVVEQSATPLDLCTVPEFVAALQAHDDEAAITAAGGGEAFRAAVVGGQATCVDMGDTSRVWTVVNKLRPANPADYRPSGLIMPEGVRNIEGGALRSDAASALASLVAGAYAAGVGEIALESAFRSYQTQEATYGRYFAEEGEEADQSSARPGYSEHQLGLAADVVACAGPCGTLDDVAAAPQGEWIAEHAWEHGWIVRYVDGNMGVTGYIPEPWHLRYIGPQLAQAYHDGGWTSLEEFFGLEPAPGYAG